MKSLFSFNGRIGRLQYVMTIILLKIITVFMELILRPISKQVSNKNTFIIIFIFVLIWSIAALTITLAATAKRLRDIDSNPWFALLILIPFVDLILFLYLAFKKGKDWQVEALKKVFRK